MIDQESKWPLVHLGDHVEFLTGFPFKSAEYTTSSEDIRLLRGDNVAQGFLRWDDAKRLPKVARGGYKKFELAEDDVILAMDRPWIEAGLKYAWVTRQDLPCLLVQRVARLRGTSELRTRFLRYIIGSPEFTSHVQSITTGVNVPHISGRDISRFRFCLPPTHAQDQVVSILSAYDDLIENNARRIAILEEMARRIFEEWFVHFRAPGCEGLPMVESTIGPVPQGWEIRALREFASVNPEQISPRNPPAEINYVDIASVSPGSINAIAWMPFDDAPNRARRIVRHGDTIWSCVRPNRRSFALVLRPTDDMIASTGFAVLRATNVPWSYLYMVVTTHAFTDYLTNHTTGSAYPAVKADDFEKAELLSPPRPVLDRFAMVIEPMLSLSHNLRLQNANLRTQRDILLPKLISGEIDVGRSAVALLEAAE
jgi:type I restriction enzyme, S subunit